MSGVQATAPLTGHVPVRFAPEVVRAVQALAASEGMTVSAWIRREVEREVSRRASPASAAAPTPGQAAYEAFMGSLTGRCPDVPVVTWERLDDLARDGYASGDTQADWEAAAQAAIAAAYAPCPDCGCAPRPHGAFCYGCGACLDVLAQHEPGSVDIGPGEQVTEIAVVPADDLAAAMAETRQLRDLTAEILAAFGPSGSGHTARVGQVQIRKWRQRAGLEGQ